MLVHEKLCTIALRNFEQMLWNQTLVKIQGFKGFYNSFCAGRKVKILYLKANKLTESRLTKGFKNSKLLNKVTLCLFKRQIKKKYKYKHGFQLSVTTTEKFSRFMVHFKLFHLL